MKNATEKRFRNFEVSYIFCNKNDKTENTLLRLFFAVIKSGGNPLICDTLIVEK